MKMTVKLRCLATCYMPVSSESDTVERYENDDGGDVYDVPEERLSEFLDTGNFERV